MATEVTMTESFISSALSNIAVRQAFPALNRLWQLTQTRKGGCKCKKGGPTAAVVYEAKRFILGLPEAQKLRLKAVLKVDRVVAYRLEGGRVQVTTF